MVPIDILQLVKLTGHENPYKSFFSLPNKSFKSRYTAAMEFKQCMHLKKIEFKQCMVFDSLSFVPELQELLMAWGGRPDPNMIRVIFRLIRNAINIIF